LAKVAEPARGFHALLKRCEATVCTAAAVPTAVNRAPRIVLSLGWSVKQQSRRTNDTERKEDRSHSHPSRSGIADDSTMKNSARRFFDLSQNMSFVCPPFPGAMQANSQAPVLTPDIPGTAQE
jgi:hypothetical protein